MTDFGLQGASYGWKTTGNPTAHSDSTALSVLGCTRYVPRTDSNFVARSGDGDNVSLRNITTHNFSGHSNGQTSMTSVVHIDGGNVAGGQVRFTNLTARVRTFHDARGYHSKTLFKSRLAQRGRRPDRPPEQRHADDGQRSRAGKAPAEPSREPHPGQQCNRCRQRHALRR